MMHKKKKIVIGALIVVVLCSGTVSAMAMNGIFSKPDTTITVESTDTADVTYTGGATGTSSTTATSSSLIWANGVYTENGKPVYCMFGINTDQATYRVSDGDGGDSGFYSYSCSKKDLKFFNAGSSYKFLYPGYRIYNGKTLVNFNAYKEEYYKDLGRDELVKPGKTLSVKIDGVDLVDYIFEKTAFEYEIDGDACYHKKLGLTKCHKGDILYMALQVYKKSNIKDIKYEYQWSRCNLEYEKCVEIKGATQKTYFVKNTDSDHIISVKVTAVKNGYEKASSFNDRGSAIIEGPKTIAEYEDTKAFFDDEDFGDEDNDYDDN
jgi:hypothetical protein